MNPWQLPETLADGVAIHAPTWLRLFRAAPRQVSAALEMFGIGVADGWQVSGTSTAATVTAGSGIARSSTAGTVALISDDEATVGVAIGDAFLFAVIQIAAVPGAPDSRETLAPVFLSHDGEELDGGVLLAEFTGGAWQDRRPRLTLAQLLADVGYSDEERAKGTVAARLTALASGGGGGDGPAVLWEYLVRNESTTTTIIQYIQVQLDALESRVMLAIATGGSRPRQSNFDQLVREHAITRQTTIQLAPPGGLRSQSANYLDTVDGLWGDGDNGSPDFITTELVLNADGSLET